MTRWMGYRGFLHRIASPNPTKRGAITRSIEQNLEAMLNSDRGTSLSSSDFGVDHQRFLARWPKSGALLCSEVERLIAEYEPRLTDARVSLANETIPGFASLSIEGRVAGRRVSLTTDVRGFGRVVVRVQNSETTGRKKARGA